MIRYYPHSLLLVCILFLLFSNNTTAGVSIEIYDSLTGGNTISALSIDTTGIIFPYVDPNENDSVTDPYLVSQIFVELSISPADNDAWRVSIYTNSNNPTSSSLNHTIDKTQSIRLKYHSTAKDTTITPSPGDPITETEWNNANLYSWLFNFTDAQLSAGGLSNLDIPTLDFTTCIPGKTASEYTSRVVLTFAIGLHHTVTKEGTYSNIIGLEVYGN